MSQEYSYVYFVSYVIGNNTPDHSFACGEYTLPCQIEKYETIADLVLVIKNKSAIYNNPDVVILNYQLMRKEKYEPRIQS